MTAGVVEFEPSVSWRITGGSCAGVDQRWSCRPVAVQVRMVCVREHVVDIPMCPLCAVRARRGEAHCIVCKKSGVGRTPLRVETTETL